MAFSVPYKSTNQEALVQSSSILIQAGVQMISVWLKNRMGLNFV